MHSDLEAIIKDDRIKLKPGDIKAYMLMTMKAVRYYLISCTSDRVSLTLNPWDVQLPEKP